MIDAQLAELTEWEANQSQVDLSRRIAKLYEDRYEIAPDADTMNSALCTNTHTNTLSAAATRRRAQDGRFGAQEHRRQTKANEDYIAQTEAWLPAMAPAREAETYARASRIPNSSSKS